MLADQKKIKQFCEGVIEDYRRELVVEQLVQVSTTEKTDGEFIQIGIRPLLDQAMFSLESYDIVLPGAGRMIALKERDFLVEQILKNKQIKIIKFQEGLEELPKHFYEFDNPIILISSKTYLPFSKSLGKRIEHKNGTLLLDGTVKITPVPEQIMGNKMIIMDEKSVKWIKKLFYNEIIDKKKVIDIQFKTHSNGKIDSTIKSVNKIESMDPNLIKILKLENF